MSLPASVATKCDSCNEKIKVSMADILKSADKPCSDSNTTSQHRPRHPPHSLSGSSISAWDRQDPFADPMEMDKPPLVPTDRSINHTAPLRQPTTEMVDFSDDFIDLVCNLCSSRLTIRRCTRCSAFVSFSPGILVSKCYKCGIKLALSGRRANKLVKNPSRSLKRG
jgi:hypothetical protein